MSPTSPAALEAAGSISLSSMMRDSGIRIASRGFGEYHRSDPESLASLGFNAYFNTSSPGKERPASRGGGAEVGRNPIIDGDVPRKSIGLKINGPPPRNTTDVYSAWKPTKLKTPRTRYPKDGSNGKKTIHPKPSGHGDSVFMGIPRKKVPDNHLDQPAMQSQSPIHHSRHPPGARHHSHHVYSRKKTDYPQARAESPLAWNDHYDDVPVTLDGDGHVIDYAHRQHGGAFWKRTGLTRSKSSLMGEADGTASPMATTNLNGPKSTLHREDEPLLPGKKTSLLPASVSDSGHGWKTKTELSHPNGMRGAEVVHSPFRRRKEVLLHVVSDGSQQEKPHVQISAVPVPVQTFHNTPFATDVASEFDTHSPSKWGSQHPVNQSPLRNRDHGWQYRSRSPFAPSAKLAGQSAAVTLRMQSP
jgi:hypothetical protein